MRVTESERRQNARGAQLRLSLPPEPRIGVQVRREFLAFAESQGVVDCEDLSDFVTAIGEALANAVEHAQTSEPIDIAIWMIGEDRLFASVHDRGVGFHPVERPIDSDLPEGLAERGRGLPIMQRCSDVFSVSSAPGQGTRITLGRYVRRATAVFEHQATG